MSFGTGGRKAFPSSREVFASHRTHTRKKSTAAVVGCRWLMSGIVPILAWWDVEISMFLSRSSDVSQLGAFISWDSGILGFCAKNTRTPLYCLKLASTSYLWLCAGRITPKSNPEVVFVGGIDHGKPTGTPRCVGTSQRERPSVVRYDVGQPGRCCARPRRQECFCCPLQSPRRPWHTYSTVSSTAISPVHVIFFTHGHPIADSRWTLS